MRERTIIKAKKRTGLLATIQYVFRANFNDTYWLEERTINFDDINDKELIWFDPFYGRSKINDTLIAISYADDEKFVVLEKKGEVVREHVMKDNFDYILCEDFDSNVMLAMHLRYDYTKKSR